MSESQNNRLIERAESEIKLRFPEIYCSPEWQKLDPIDRGQLLLVMEGVKPGAYIGGDLLHSRNIFKQAGLAYQCDTSPSNNLRMSYGVASPDVLNRYFRRELLMLAGANRADSHRIAGEFLGYPPCCVEEYISRNKFHQACDISAFARHFRYNFEYESALARVHQELYPTELDIRPPTFTPCCLHCENALKTLRLWERVLEVADPQVAQSLRFFNWDDVRAGHVGESSSLRTMRQLRQDIRGSLYHPPHQNGGRGQKSR